MLRKKFVYMGMLVTYDGGGSGSVDESEEPDEDPFNPDIVDPNELPAEMTDPHDRAKAREYIRGAYAAILAGDTSAFLMNMSMLRSLTFEYDVDYAEKVLEYFGEFERAINSIRASMQGFSMDEGTYKLTELEYKALKKAQQLLEDAGYSLEDVEGGDIVQKLLDGYEDGVEVEISKHDANRVMQFITQMETKLLPSDSKQEVVAAQLEATSKKRDAFYDTVLPTATRNSYGK